MKRGPLLALVLVAGCKKHEPAKPPAPPPPAEPAGLQVASTGAPPQTLLRYHLAKGTTTKLELAVDASLTAGTMGGAVPGMTFDLEIVVDDVLPDGRMKLHTTIADASVVPGPGSASTAPIAGQLDAIKGLAITSTLSPDGKIEDSQVDTGGKKLPDDVTQQLGSLSASLEQTAMPLPAVPVGVGARWTTTRALDQGGMKMTSATTVELTAIDGARVSFTDHSEIHGPDQTVTQGDVAIQATHIAGTGSGHGTIDLSKLELTRDYDAQFHAQMAAGGQDTPMTLEMKMTMAPR